MTAAFAYTVQLTQIECGQCGIVFAMPEKVRAERQKNGNNFYCPNGHPRVYRESDLDKAQRELAEERQRKTDALARANEAEAKLRAQTKKFDSHKKRVAAGTCPCCQRTFKQLVAHMKNKHPEYTNGT